MKNKKFSILIIIIILLAGVGFIFRDNLLSLAGITQSKAPRPAGKSDPSQTQTTIIRAANNVNQVSASGNIAVVNEYAVVLQQSGIVETVAVNVGDSVRQNDLLARLRTADLERAVQQAELDLASAQANLDSLLEEATPAEIASAQASLASAQENLVEVQAGASEAELAAAQANLEAAWASYNNLLSGPGDDELIQLSAAMESAFITLQQAQYAYDAIAYSDSVGSSGQAAALQQATIDYESAKASYNIAVAEADQAELLSAWGAIQSAQESLNTLQAKPTSAELASAEAQVASAMSQLETLLNGPSDAALHSAEINVEKARLDLASAEQNLAEATLNAPINGTILTINVTEGTHVTTDGLTAMTMSDLSQLELTVGVAEIDIPKIGVGQAVQVTISALPEQVFNGRVSRIEPYSNASGGVVYYPVTIEMADDDLSGILPGMTAVAEFIADQRESTWMVPSSALKETNNQTLVMIMREGRPVPVQVEKVGTQGEWSIVQSEALQAGDEALGTVTSFIKQDADEVKPAIRRIGGGK